MSEFLRTSEVTELFEGLREGSQAVFGNRLMMPHYREHFLTTTTADERYDLRYTPPEYGSVILSGTLEIGLWVPSEMEIPQTVADIEADFESDVFMVDRTTFYFNLYNQDYDRIYSLSKCVADDERLYEIVEDAPLVCVGDMEQVSLEAQIFSDWAELETGNITYKDRYKVSHVFNQLGVVI